VLIKAILALGIVAAGAYNRRRLLPRLRAVTGSPGQTGVILRRVLRFELLLGVLAIGVTGALSSYAPSTAVSSGPYATTVNVGPARMEVTVDPARVGPNQLHVYLFDRKTGAAYTAAKELRVTASTKQIAKLALNAHQAGPGHYVVDGAPLPQKGDWTIETTIRVSDFDEFAQRFTVPIS
jgi:copper transport protein